MSCGVQVYADDSKLYRSVLHRADALAVQHDMDRAIQWPDEWQLTFNTTKCKVLHIGQRNSHDVYALNGVLLEETEAERDLDVYMDADLKFRKQDASAVSMASQVLVVVRNSFQLLDKSTFPLLFKVLVRPHLEYGTLVWGPFNRSDQKLVERVRRRATKLVPDATSALSGEAPGAQVTLSVLPSTARGYDRSLPAPPRGLDLNPQAFFNT